MARRGFRMGVASLSAVMLTGITTTGISATAVAAPDVLAPPAPTAVLVKCKAVAAARCGSVVVPLDRNDPASPNVTIKYELHGHRLKAEPSLGTIVAVEGGPGYPTRASRDSYLELFDPLLDRRDLLLVDNRGTGTSGVIVCDELQSYVGESSVNAGKCAAQLGAAADDYGSGAAAEDLVAVLDSLGLEEVDLYGDSYGTFFSQAFAVRYPDRLRSLVLDAAYPIEGADPWYRDSARATRRALRLACARQPSCAAVGGDPIIRLRRLADRLRETPIVGDARDADGARRTITLDPGVLAYIAWAGSGVPDVYRELDPAVRAALRPVDADNAPLLRLAAENLPQGDAGPPKEFSEGLYAAVACHDYPEPYDPHADLATRRAQYDAAVTALPPRSFAPFTMEEWVEQPQADYDYCIEWPASSVDDPPFPVNARYPRVPTLVLTSDLDSNTSPDGARTVARKFGGTLVESVNYTHVSALGDFGRCASQIVVRFVRTRSPGDTQCSREYNETRVVDEFVRSASHLPSANPDQQLAQAVAATAGDVIARWWQMLGSEGVGLRGGTFTTTGDPMARFRLHNVRWAEDVTVNGTIAWKRDTGNVAAQLTARGPNGARAMFTITWNDWTPHATATATGVVDDRAVEFSFPAS